ncbi:META domain-containing protein [Chloroflexota bacterium]
MKLKLFTLTILMVAVFLAGCGNGVSLEDTEWVLESYGQQGNLETVLADTEVTATFKSADKQVAGSGGCNGYSGSYELSGNKLSIPWPLMSTMMSCGDAKDRQEQQFFKSLQSAESYKIDDGKLTINCGDNILVFSQK